MLKCQVPMGTYLYPMKCLNCFFRVSGPYRRVVHFKLKRSQIKNIVCIILLVLRALENQQDV